MPDNLNEAMPPVEYVHNPDVRTLYDLTNRLVYEICYDVSVNAQEVHAECINKIKTNLAAFKAKVLKSQTQPIPYPSKTHPTKLFLSVPNPVKDIENICLKGVATWVCVIRDEVANSESSRNPTGVTENDSRKWFVMVDKCLQAFDADMEIFTDLDFSESSPMIAGVTAGRRGLNPTDAA